MLEQGTAHHSLHSICFYFHLMIFIIFLLCSGGRVGVLNTSHHGEKSNNQSFSFFLLLLLAMKNTELRLDFITRLAKKGIII